MSYPEEALSSFKSWFSSVGGYIHPSVELVYDSTVGVHLRVKQDHIRPLQRDTLVISCPHSSSLSALNAQQINGGCFPVPQTTRHSEGDVLVQGKKRTANGVEKTVHDGPDDVIGDLQVPDLLRRDARPQFVAAVWVAVQYLLSERSPWKAYIDILPGLPTLDDDAQDVSTQLAGFAKLDTPLWWTEKERSWIQGTNLAKGIADLEGVWEAEWRQWEDALVPWGRLHGLELTWSLVKYGLTILGSRAFSSSQVATHVSQAGQSILEFYDPDMLLYPGVDSLNHNPLTKNRWHSDDRCFGIVVEDDLTAGMEVFNPYGGKGNGELLLSYGFCLPDNPCDSYSIRLPPHLPPLIKILYEAGRGVSKIADYDHRVPEHRVVSAAGTSPMTPHNRPPPHNLEHNTYYIRPLSRHSLDEDGYPSSESHRTDPELALIPPINTGLLGFPDLLLSMLATSIATPSEVSAVAANPPAYDTMNLWNQLGPRTRIALCNLLLQRLTLELTRIPLPSSTVQSQRQEWTNIYLIGQRQILTDNISALEKGLMSYLTPGLVLTLQNALDVLEKEEERRTFIADIAAVYGIEIPEDANQASTLISQARALDFEEDIWALWIGVIVHKCRAGIEEDEKQQKPSSRPLQDLFSWCTFLATAYGLGADTQADLEEYDEVVDEDEDEDDDDPATHLLTVLSALRTTGGPPSSLWSKTLWTRQYTAACAAVVQAETFSFRFAPGSKLDVAICAVEHESSSFEEHIGRGGARSSNEGGEREAEREVVALYVGPTMEISSRGKV